MGVNKFKRPLLVEGTEVPPEGGFGGGAVDSVNGQTGDVTLDASDVGALPDDTELLTIGTTATTAKAGNYQPTWAQVTGKPEFGTAATTDASAYATSAQGSLAASAVQPGDLSTVATSGAYGDLSGTPTIPVVSFATISAIEGDWRGEGVETLGAALVALQGV